MTAETSKAPVKCTTVGVPKRVERAGVGRCAGSR